MRVYLCVLPTIRLCLIALNEAVGPGTFVSAGVECVRHNEVTQKGKTTLVVKTSCRPWHICELKG